MTRRQRQIKQAAEAAGLRLERACYHPGKGWDVQLWRGQQSVTIPPDCGPVAFARLLRRIAAVPVMLGSAEGVA